MKKQYLVLLLMLSALILAAVGMAESEADELTTTVLVYMCGSDLQSAACDDLQEMVAAETGGNFHIQVLAGGALKWDYQALQADHLNLITIADGGVTDIVDLGSESMARRRRCNPSWKRG